MLKKVDLFARLYIVGIKQKGDDSMTDKDIMLQYIQKFRLECHYRLDMTAADFEELPIHIYRGAHRGACEELVNELSLSKDFQSKLDSIYNYFEKAVVKEDNYNTADELTVKAIEDGQFSL